MASVNDSVEEQVGQQRQRRIHRVAREVGDAGLAQHLVVDEEAAR